MLSVANSLLFRYCLRLQDRRYDVSLLVIGVRKIVTMKKILDLLLGVFYPDLCIACAEAQPVHGQPFCFSCSQLMPQTHYHKLPENQMMDRLYGRIDLVAATALYFFTKESRVQQVLHQLKYNERPDVGVTLGEIHGRILRDVFPYKTAAGIVPVPLHPRRQKERGYNQSMAYAEGLSAAMGIPIFENALRRRTYTETQTRKSRIARLANVDEVFEITDAGMKLGQKHVILVDDVMTTGATIEACCKLLTSQADARVSIATIALVSG